jgi:hypothetical protein
MATIKIEDTKYAGIEFEVEKTVKLIRDYLGDSWDTKLKGVNVTSTKNTITILSDSSNYVRVKGEILKTTKVNREQEESLHKHLVKLLGDLKCECKVYLNSQLIRDGFCKVDYTFKTKYPAKTRKGLK